MGAHDFTTTTTGKTATKAYETAVADARYEYGNDPYNGTISTTNGFEELPESLFKGMRAKTRLAILEGLAMGDTNLHNPPSKKAIEVFGALRARGYRGCDKWGRCYAVRINHNTFAFSGLAAS